MPSWEKLTDGNLSHFQNRTKQALKKMNIQKLNMLIENEWNNYPIYVKRGESVHQLFVLEVFILLFKMETGEDIKRETACSILSEEKDVPDQFMNILIFEKSPNLIKAFAEIKTQIMDFQLAKWWS
eukprot:Pgem_evm2s19175